MPYFNVRMEDRLTSKVSLDFRDHQLCRSLMSPGILYLEANQIILCLSKEKSRTSSI